MTFVDVILSLGGGGVTIVAIGWFSKLLAEYLIKNQTQQYQVDLEKLKANLLQSNQEILEKLKTDLIEDQQKKLTSFHERLAIYKTVVDVFGEFLFNLQAHFSDGYSQSLFQTSLLQFEKLRMRTYGYLSLLASQNVMDKHEALVETILNSLEAKEDFDWPNIRQVVLDLLNAAREDLGIDTHAIVYRGNR